MYCCVVSNCFVLYIIERYQSDKLMESYQKCLKINTHIVYLLNTHEKPYSVENLFSTNAEMSGCCNN